MEYKKIIGNLEQAHLFRRIFAQRTTSGTSLHFGQVAIMRYIIGHDNCTQTDLAERLKVSAASIATSTKRLQRAGLITKSIDECNLRCKHLSVTEKGRTLMLENERRFGEYDKAVFANFTDDELDKFNYCLEKLVSEMARVEGIPREEDVPLALGILFDKMMENKKIAELAEKEITENV